MRPFPFEQVEQVVETELGLSLERAFLDFDPTPIAAASIGQVHRATLPNGKRVAVKVQRPGAPRQIEADLALLYQAAQASRRSASARSTSSTRASSSTSSAARSAQSSTTAPRDATPSASAATGPATRTSQIPRVYWSYTRARVLTLEFLEGIQVADVDPDDVHARGAAADRVPDEPRRG